MKPPVVCIVGKKKSGKTTFIEKLIPVLSEMGMKIGTVKHDVHGFEMDVEGKDSWRHRQCGAKTVCVSSPNRVAVIREVERELTLREIAAEYYQDRDLVIAEGFFSSDLPKIEVFRSEAHKNPLSSRDEAWEGSLLACVSDVEIDAGVPCYNLDDAAGVAAFLCDWFGLGCQ